MKGLTEEIAFGFKLWLETTHSKSVFGGGKWRLLKEIDERGSLSAAAEKLSISYRKAWGDIRKTELALNVKLLDRHRGGKDGGETRLTDEGKKWLREYGRFQQCVEGAVRLAYRDWQKRMRISGKGAVEGGSPCLPV